MTRDADAPAHDDCVETVPVRLEVLGIEPVRGRGRLVGLAIVDIEVAGFALQLQGVQIVRRPDGQIECRAPVFRHPHDGRWLPAVLIPPALSDAIAAEVLASVKDRGDIR